MKEGDLTTEQQAEMIAEASGWRRRALVAEAALKVSRAETEKAARFAISRAAPATPPSPSCLGVVEALSGGRAVTEQWEYCVLREEYPPTVKEMNAIGDDGWELVSAYTTSRHMGGTQHHVFVFKRRAL